MTWRDFLHEFEKAADNSPFSWYSNTRRQDDTGYGIRPSWGERLYGMQEVTGSIPVFSLKKHCTSL